MSTQMPLSEDDPRMKAWHEYISTAEFENSLNWAKAFDVSHDLGSNAVSVFFPHLEDSMWAVFIAGYEAGSKKES